MVRLGLVVKSHKTAIAYRNIPGTLEYCGTLVDFVEHGHINHFGSLLYSAGKLFPKEVAVVAVNLQALRPFHVFPGETRETQGSVIYILGFTPFDVISDKFLIKGVGAFIITAYKPRHDNIALLYQCMEPGVGLCVIFELTPMSRHSQHHTEALLFQSVNNSIGFFESILATVIESHTPYHYKRAAVMPQIRRIVRTVLKTEHRCEFAYIIQKYLLVAGIHPRQVVHDTESAPVFVGSHARVIEQFGKMLLPGRILDFRDKTLHEHSVEPILFHPTKVGVDS